MLKLGRVNRGKQFCLNHLPDRIIACDHHIIGTQICLHLSQHFFFNGESNLGHVNPVDFSKPASAFDPM